jgi:single-stranded-DNA-specific exonuclease
MQEVPSQPDTVTKNSHTPLPLLVRKRSESADSITIARKISTELGVHFVTSCILAQRGVGTVDEAKAFLSPTLRNNLPDPSGLKNAHDAVNRIYNSIKEKRYITLFSDFDVDGITSASQMWHVLAPAGAKVRHYVPNRMTEGYGLSVEAIEQLHREKTQLLVTLDCGITNCKEVARAKELGLEVVIIDHHEPGEKLPPADTIVNPMQNGCPFQPFKMATAGIAWLLCILLLRKIENEGTNSKNSLPTSKELIDLAAIGTICDMVPLTGVNRLIASRGLDSIRSAPRPGVKVLKEISQLPFGDRFSCSHVSFGIGPRLNAAGRLNDASLGFQLLISPPSQEIKDIAVKLNKLNLERRSLEEETRETCLSLAALSKTDSDGSPLSAFALYDDSFHPGVIGIAAQRLVEALGRPVAVMAPGESVIHGNSTSVIKGSVRSVPEFHVAKALSALTHLLHTHGGHAEAGGFTLLPENLASFRNEFNLLAKEIFKKTPPKKEINIDYIIPFKDITIQLVHEIQSLAPFGTGNPSPLFLTSNVVIEHLQLIGESHIKLQLNHDTVIRNAIGWRMRGHPLVLKNKRVDVIFSLEINTYKGISSVQLIIKELLEPNSAR